MSTVLVPTNLNQADATAFRFALGIAQRYGWKLQLAHVSPIVFGAGDMPIYLPKEEMEASLAAFFANILLSADEKAYLNEVGADKIVLIGPPASVLLEHAKQLKPALIVAARAKKSAFERTIFGSVSSDLMRLAESPVLLVPEHAVFRGFEDIVFAADMASTKPAILHRAVAVAKAFGSCIQFLHIGENVIEDMQIRERLFKELFKDGEPPFGWGYSSFESTSVEEGLNDWLLDMPAQLVILSTRHRGFFESLGHHSVTSGMARDPLAPLLVLHEEDADGSLGMEAKG